jgi:hypothetical protein
LSTKQDRSSLSPFIKAPIEKRNHASQTPSSDILICLYHLWLLTLKKYNDYQAANMEQVEENNNNNNKKKQDFVNQQP